MSLFDAPLIVANLVSPRYEALRWVGADAINFFGSRVKSWLFTAGKCVPVVRGTGLDQPGFRFLVDRLKQGDWVHIFRRERGPATHEAASAIRASLASAF